MNDLEIIALIEKELGIKLEKLDVIGYGKRAYTTDRNDKVTGIGLYDCVESQTGSFRIFSKDKAKVRIEKLADLLGQLENLKVLDFSQNNISDVTWLGRFTNLERLYLSRNKISNINALAGLNKLETLYLSFNKISNIIALQGLARLKLLELSFNDIINIIGLAGLGNLAELWLTNNNITNILPLRGLQNLTTLDLRRNPIEELPPWITEYNMGIRWIDKVEGSDGYITFAGNPLKSPPVELVKQGKEAMKNWYSAAEKTDLMPINELKLIIIGDGGSGKTSLLNRIQKIPFNIGEQQTHGINIINKTYDNINNRNITVHFWDFGGQQIMHAMHQFFLTSDTFYILVIDSRREEKVEYWLRHIETFGNGSPTIIVINKIDETPKHDVNRNHLIEKYPFIVDFARISCKTDEGINNLLSKIQNEILKLKLLAEKWPASWFNIRSELENIKNSFDSHYIGMDQYIDLCNNNKVTNNSEQETLVEYLHNLGVITHYKSLDLQNLYILEPKWVTEAVYKIISSNELEKCNGVLSLDLLDKILKPTKSSDYIFPRETYNYIIHLMIKYELCHQIDNNSVLIPDLLDIQEPTLPLMIEESVRFVIDYKSFLPPSVMPRFIVKMHNDIKDELRWLTGVVLQSALFDSLATVRSDRETKKINIIVSGKNRREYLGTIRHTFNEINLSYAKLKVDERICMPDNPSITASYKHWINMLIRGDEEDSPEGADKKYNIGKVLENIDQPIRISHEEILDIIKANKLSLAKIQNDLINIINNIPSESSDYEKFLDVIQIKLGPINISELAKIIIKEKRKKKTI